MTFPLAMGEAEAALRAAQEAQQTPEAYWRAVADKAMVIANAMVVTGGGPAFMSRRTFAWRAQRLGPEVAAADFEKGRYGGWGSHYWNPDGTLKDPEGAGWTEDELKEMRRGAAL